MVLPWDEIEDWIREEAERDFERSMSLRDLLVCFNGTEAALLVFVRPHHGGDDFEVALREMYDLVRLFAPDRALLACSATLRLPGHDPDVGRILGGRAVTVHRAWRDGHRVDLRIDLLKYGHDDDGELVWGDVVVDAEADPYPVGTRLAHALRRPRPADEADVRTYIDWMVAQGHLVAHAPGGLDDLGTTTREDREAI